MARPKKYDVKKMAQDIRDYTDDTSIPILKEICYLSDWNYDSVMRLQRENDELCQSIKRLLNKKEAQLEKLAIIGVADKTMAIFSLKQLGWRDKQEDSSGVERVTIVDDL